jgi:hypothetical protein
MQALVKKSAIPSLTVDVTDCPLDEQVDYIADWLETTGGLNATETAPEPNIRLIPSFRRLAQGSWIGQPSRIANSL